MAILAGSWRPVLTLKPRPSPDRRDPDAEPRRDLLLRLLSFLQGPHDPQTKIIRVCSRPGPTSCRDDRSRVDPGKYHGHFFEIDLRAAESHSSPSPERAAASARPPNPEARRSQALSRTTAASSRWSSARSAESSPSPRRPRRRGGHRAAPGCRWRMRHRASRAEWQAACPRDGARPARRGSRRRQTPPCARVKGSRCSPGPAPRRIEVLLTAREAERVYHAHRRVFGGGFG